MQELQGHTHKMEQKYPVNPVDAKTEADLLRRFTYHAPKGQQSEKYGDLRQMAHIMANTIVRLSPQSREQSLALTHLEETIFWVNAAIARNE